ncbi:MAG: aldehyde:ferredoxin oxidoreductase [Candidatus Latescibacteria bacterium]|nr:aldehyde:ferredoxin oxidoreductase [Candidatus Latescibacterota bacterium]
MPKQNNGQSLTFSDFAYRRATVDLTNQTSRIEERRCEDMEDFMGGIARAFKFLARYEVRDPYAPDSPLLMNTGLLSGTEVMTGLRVFFSAYSPLKTSNAGLPGAMWSAVSGELGTKLRYAGLDEALFVGRAAKPVYLVISGDGTHVELAFHDASDLVGRTTQEKIMALLDRYQDAHFAAIGPAGEHYDTVRYAAIAGSTINQLRSRDAKSRFAGRGGMGGVMGSKNLLAIVAQAQDPKGERLSEEMKKINHEIARGPGSRKFRDADKADGLGGTWSNYPTMHAVHILPENNFRPTGSDAPAHIFREAVEEEFLVKDESCFRCGIACHKNLYERKDDGKAGAFLAKWDYEPLNLLTTNLGIHDRQAANELILLVDHLGFDSISLGTTLGYVMDYNRRRSTGKIADGLSFGDAETTLRIITRIAHGQEPLLGQGTKRLADQLGERAYAMQCKGVELPAYLPDTNPGYPFAIAGGHMSMQTFLLLANEKDTSLDYWEKAITERGLYQIRDDITGLCKFAGLNYPMAAQAITEVTGVPMTEPELRRVVLRTFLRGYALERKQGFAVEDYVLPEQTYDPNPNIKLPAFITRSFFEELRSRVLRRFDAMVAEQGVG